MQRKFCFVSKSSLKAMLLHTKSVVLETLTCVFSKTRATHVSRVRKNFANKQVACCTTTVCVCLYFDRNLHGYVVTVRMRAPNIVGCSVQTHPTLLNHAWLTAKQRKCWALVLSSFNLGCLFGEQV